ncbi:hypothetical protein ACFS5J_12415 [Flavobacterium chuncheonense]|uniref:Uncharacterized protein n=1 Tax=Flavobacterium chuncheonense TaxID=2026653 RepID=A0ABW5YPB4_9FLAO
MKNNSIKNLKHCHLCKNKLYKIEFGTHCSLTNKAPAFETKCDKIVFDYNLEDKIKLINIEFERVRIEKKWAYLYFITFLIMGIGMLIFTYHFVEYCTNILNKRMISLNTALFITIPIIFISISFVLISYAFGAINRHRNDKKVIEAKKNELDKILTIYNIVYTIKIKLKDRILKPTNVETELKIMKK